MNTAIKTILGLILLALIIVVGVPIVFMGWPLLLPIGIIVLAVDKLNR